MEIEEELERCFIKERQETVVKERERERSNQKFPIYI
jgi:hypothetical protein